MALGRKSVTDITRRKSRSLLTILTIGLAVGSIGLFAVPALMKDAMDEEVARNQLFDLRLQIQDSDLNETHFDTIESLENVNHVEPRSFFVTRMYIGARRADVILWGIWDFEDQNVNVIDHRGTIPTSFQVLTDVANTHYSTYAGSAGDDFTIVDSTGTNRTLGVAGEARSSWYGSDAREGYVVLYAPMETVKELGNFSGVSRLNLDLVNTDDESVNQTIEDSRAILDQYNVSFADLPRTRDPTTYPGEEDVNNIMAVFYLVTVLAVFSSVFLIANTMNTIIAEQTPEIGSMKAVGATRRQIASSYLRTALLMGIVGGLVGLLLGVLTAHFLVVFFANWLFGVTATFALHWPTLAISFVVGVVLSALSTVPALMKSMRISAREALESRGISAGFGKGVVDYALMRTTRLPRSMQMGIRNMGRKKGRSLATSLQIAITVGSLLGIMAVGSSLVTSIEIEWDTMNYDLLVGSTAGSKEFDNATTDLLLGIDGVAYVEPYFSLRVEIEGTTIGAMGLVHNTTEHFYHPDLVDGRWFTAQEEQSAMRVVVITETFANEESIEVGDELDITTAAGPELFTVVGIDANQLNNGKFAFFPLQTIQSVLDANHTASAYFIRTTSTNTDLIDATTTRVEDALSEGGYNIFSEVFYVAKAQNVRQNMEILNVIYVLGLIIVGISMIGLANALTMNVLERTKEIGIMRCLGARSGHIRRAFGFEGVSLSVAGWLLGIPIGYLVARWMLHQIWLLFDFKMTFVFPLPHLWFVLLGTVVLALVVMYLPLRRAARFRPGEALRYQ